MFRIVKSTDPIFGIVRQRSVGRCECVKKDGGVRCHRNAEHVIEEDDCSTRDICRECRLYVLGMSRQEKTAATKAFKARQISLFGAPEKKVG